MIKNRAVFLRNANRLNNTSFHAAKSLHDAGMLNQTNLKKIRTSQFLQKAIICLHQAGLLNETNLIQIRNNFIFQRAVISLHSSNILNQENFNLIVNFPLLAITMCYISQVNLTQQEFDSIRSSELLQQLIKLLHELGLIEADPENVHSAITYPKPYDLLLLLQLFQNNNIFKKLDDPYYYLQPISQPDIAANANLNQDRFRLLLHKPFQEVIWILDNSNILDETNFNLLKNCPDPDYQMILSALTILMVAGRLTQDTFKTIIDSTDPQSTAKKIIDSSSTHTGTAGQSPNVAQSLFGRTEKSRYFLNILDGLTEISNKYIGPHKSKLDDLIKRCKQCSTWMELKKEIDKLTETGGGLGYGRLNAALCELSREISHQELFALDNNFLGRLAVDKNATRASALGKRNL